MNTQQFKIIEYGGPGVLTFDMRKPKILSLSLYSVRLRLSDHFSIYGLVFYVLKSLLGIVRKWRREKFAILTLKSRSHVRILIFRTWATVYFSLACSRLQDGVAQRS